MPAPEASARRWAYLTDVGLWPRMVEFNWRGWLSNFPEGELVYAARLLDSFLYLSQPMTRQLFRSAFLSASEQVVDKQPLSQAKAQWGAFLDDLIVVRVTGERPSSADSGYAFTRLARDDLEIPETQLLESGHAIAKLLRGEARDVMFVDDFVGSGDQFKRSWARRVEIPGHGRMLSFQDLVRERPGQSRFFFCTAMSTEYGIGEIRAAAPEVLHLSGQTLDARASAIANPSFIWREDLADAGPTFIRSASERAGIPMADGTEDQWSGFRGLGLCVAFSHGWPDATLPLFHWSANGWIPLLVKGAV